MKHLLPSLMLVVLLALLLLLSSLAVVARDRDEEEMRCFVDEETGEETCEPLHDGEEEHDDENEEEEFESVFHEDPERDVDSELRAIEFHVVNDRERLKAYGEALRTVVRESSRVLELDSGLGLISMLAARLKAERVVAYERNEASAEASREIFQANNLTEERVDVVSREETLILALLSRQQIVKEELELTPSNACDVLILSGESMRSPWLLGAGVLDTIHELKTRNVIAHNAVIVPPSATIIVQLVETTLGLPAPGNDEVEGIKLGDALREKRALGVKHTVDLTHAVSNFLSAPAPAFILDFSAENTYREFDHVLLDFPVTKAGALHGVGLWWEASLGNEGRKIGNVPGTHGASYIHQMVLAMPTPDREVSVGENVKVRIFRTTRDVFVGGEKAVLVRVMNTRCNIRARVFLDIMNEVKLKEGDDDEETVTRTQYLGNLVDGDEAFVVAEPGNVFRAEFEGEEFHQGFVVASVVRTTGEEDENANEVGWMQEFVIDCRRRDDDEMMEGEDDE